MPAAIVALVLVAWLVVAGLPFGGDPGIDPRQAASVTETIGEGSNPFAEPNLGVVTDTSVPLTSQMPPPLILPEGSSTMPPIAPMTPIPEPMPPEMPPPMVSSPPARPSPMPPVTRLPPVTYPPTNSQEPAPKPEPEPEPGLSSAEASGALSRYLSSSNYYEVDAGCLDVRSEGRSSVAFRFSVWNHCGDGGGSKRLGLWMVDAKSGDIAVEGGGNYRSVE